MSFIVVLTTVANEREAAKIARALLKAKLVACANIVKDVRSLFWWQGTIEESREVLVIMKTNSKLLNDLMNAIKKLHRYEVPEIVALPIKRGFPLYLDWVKSSIRKV